MFKRIRLVDLSTLSAFILTSGTLLHSPIANAMLPVHSLQDPPPATDNSDRSYLAGNGFLNRGLYDLAAKEYEKFLAANPSHPKADNARYGLGVSQYRLNQFQEAASTLAPLHQLPDFQFAPEVALLLGQSYMAIGQYAEAGDSFDRILRKFEDHVSADEAAALMAESRYRQGNYEAVKEPNLFILKHFPESEMRDRAELFWGLSHMAMENFSDAARRFEKFLERSPDGQFADRASLLLARSYQREGATASAIGQYQQVIEDGNEAFQPDALMSLGSILLREDQPAEAGQLFDQLFESYESSGLIPQARMERGRAYFDLDEYKASREQFKLAAATEKVAADRAAYWIAKCDLRLDDFDAAAAGLSQAIEAFPESSLQPEMQYDRAIAFLRSNKQQPAIEALDAFRENFPDHAMAADALMLTANTHHQLGDYAASREDAVAFLAQHGNHPRAVDLQFLAAENTFLSSDFETAANEYQAFLDEHADAPQKDNATFRLGMANFRLDNFEAALPLLQTIVDGNETPAAFRSALRTLGDIHFQSADWPLAEQRFAEYLASSESPANADDALLRLGLAQQRQDKVDAAITSFDQLLADFPDSPHRPQAMFERGQSLLAMKESTAARQQFETLLKEFGDSRFTAYSLNHLAGLAMQEERFDDAADIYNTLSQQPDASPDMQAEALFQRGQALVALKNFEAAQPVFAQLIEQFPEHTRIPAARANQAIAFARLDQSEQVIEHVVAIKQSIADDLPADLLSTLLYEKAWAQRDLEQLDDVKATYRALIERDGTSELPAFARIELAELLATEDAHEEVIALLDPFMQEEADVNDAIRERSLYRGGASQYELGEFEASAATFDTFLQEFPTSELADSAILLAGESLFRVNRHGVAAERLRELINNSEDPALRGPGLLRLGESLIAKQEWDESAAVFSTYLEEFPESDLWFQAQFGLGFALENKGEYDKAIENYAKVIDRHKGPTAARAQFQIGESLFAQKKHEEAVRELLKVDILYAYPEWSAAALYEAGRAFEAMAQTGQARKHFALVTEQYADSKWADLAAKRIEAIDAATPPGRGGGG